MDGHKKLFRAIGEIPEDYVEDALNDRVVKAGKISWKSLAAAAAVFAAVVSVPAAVGIMKNKPGTQDTVPAHTTFVSEMQAETDFAADDKESEISENTDRQLGTGPEMPEGYRPDLTYSYVDFGNDNVAWDKENIERILMSRINSEGFSVKIAEDIDNTANECFRYFDSHLNEEQRAKLNSDIEEWSAIEDGYHDNDGWKNYGCKLSRIINGYLTVQISVNFDVWHLDIVRVYDIINEKIIENDSDMFFSGTDYIAKSEEYCNSAYVLDEDTFIDENAIDETSPFTVVGADYVIRSYGDFIMQPDSFMAGSEVSVTDMPQLFSVMVSGLYRDVSDYVAEGTAENLQWDRVWYYGQKNENIAGESISVMLENSVFYSEEEIRAHNADRIALYEKIFEKFADEGNESALDCFRNNGMSVFEFYGRQLQNLECISYATGKDIKYLLIDQDTSEFLSVEDILGDWHSCVSGIFRESWDDEDGYRREIITDSDINGYSNYSVVDWNWDHAWYIPEEDRSLALDGYSEFLSDSEIEKLDKIAYSFELINHATGDVVYAVALIPIEQIDSRYFDREQYVSAVRSWDK